MASTELHTRPFSWLKPFAVTVGICLFVAGVSRLFLVAVFYDRVSAAVDLGTLFVQGIRFDLVTLGYLLAIPMAITPILNSIESVREPWLRVLRIWLLLIIGLFSFMEVATYTFVKEYDVRPNFLFVEYLKYPKEVLSMLFSGYKLSLLAAAVAIPGIVWASITLTDRYAGGVKPNSKLLALPLMLIALVACGVSARSTFDHRGVNPSTVAFSNDSLVNTLSLNSLYSVMHAAYELRHEDADFAYGDVDTSAAISAVRAGKGLQGEAFIDADIPTLHYQESTRQAAGSSNLVIVIEESLGAEFVGSLGGLPLTPNLDRYSHEGIWLEQLYATGTRSARGLEAIVAGFPPTTSQSVLKLGRAQSGFFTLGEYLKRQGFDTSFIYGGEAQFDNMRRFFANNGFDSVIDKHDFVDPVFFGSWGASDEDVFNHAHQKFTSYGPEERFFSVLFTTSNHTPWAFPDDRIELYDAEKATVNNAVKYADYALGQFLDTAKQSPYWNNTVFLIVSDHNSRVYGSEIVPIERFHIPGLILGGEISAQRIERVVSQIDLLPTMLSLIGVSGFHPAVGIDLTRDDLDQFPERAVMQFRDVQAYREGKNVVVLRKELPPATFSYENGLLTVAEPDQALIDRAMNRAAWPVLSYQKQQYRLPGDT